MAIEDECEISLGPHESEDGPLTILPRSVHYQIQSSDAWS